MNYEKFTDRIRSPEVGTRVKVIKPPFDDGFTGIVVEFSNGLCLVEYDATCSPLSCGVWKPDELEVL